MNQSLVLTEYPDAATEKLWDAFLADASFPTHYVTPNFFVDPYIRGGVRFAVLCLNNDRVDAVLTGVDAGKTIFSGLAVRPQTAFRRGCDLRAAASTLLEGIKEHGGSDLEMIRFYTWEPVSEFDELGFKSSEATDDEAIIMLDLSVGAEEIFKQFSQTRRNELRKAMKQNVLEVKDLETEDEFNELYAIHCDWNERKGNTPDSYDDLKFAVSQKNHRKVLIAKLDGKVIAGSYYRFCSGGVVEYAANNSLVEFQKYRPNDLIGWRSIEWACQNGFTHYSMGGSHLFLRRFGGSVVKSHYYHLDRTFLQIHDMKDKLKEIGIKTYRSLPGGVKKQIKRIAGKE